MAISKRLVVIYLALLLLAHLTAVFFGWYVYFWIDITFHFLGGTWAALFFFLLFDHFVGEHAHHQTSEKIKILIIAASFTSLLGVFWEAQQFIMSEYFSIYLQRSVSDMIISMMVDILGGVVVSMAILYLKNNQSKPVQ